MGAAQRCRGLALGWARRWLAGTALSCTGFSLEMSPPTPAPIHIPPATSCASTTQGTLHCHQLLHTLGSPEAPGRWAGTARHCPSAADPAGTLGPSSPITAWGHPATADVVMLGGPPGCPLVAACPSGLGKVPSPDGTHQADYRKHLMRTSCPRGGKVALGTVWSGGSRCLTWLQAKWAKSPEASDPWKEKWGEVGGHGTARAEEQEHQARTIPGGQDRAPGTGTGTDDKRAHQHLAPPSRPFLPRSSPTSPGHEGMSRNVYG